MFISYSVSDPGREFPGSFAVLEPPGAAERNLLQAYMPKVVLHHPNDMDAPKIPENVALVTVAFSMPLSGG
jgi:hypothetical protein